MNEATKKQLELINELKVQVKAYENDEKLMCKSDVSRLYTNLTQTITQLQNTICPHDSCSIFRGIHTDVGYGCDRYYTHYDLCCDDCGRSLIYRSIDDKRKIHEGLPLIEALETYKKYERIYDNDLNNIGIRREEKVTYETRFVRK